MVMNQSYQSWVPLRFLELEKWTTIWNGQDASACRILDIVEEGETRETWPVVDLFNADGATTIGLYPDEKLVPLMNHVSDPGSLIMIQITPKEHPPSVIIIDFRNGK